MSSFQSQPATAKSAAENNLRAAANQFDEAAFQKAVLGQICQRMGQFTDGIRAYQNYPRAQRLAEPPVLKQIGAARLLDYGALSTNPAGPPVLLVPSLINRAYILDLAPEQSLVRYMAAQGLRPLLVDWGQPGETEADYNLEAYITGPLQGFFDMAARDNAQPPAVLGYCMGGLLALALAQRNRAAISSLSLLATPWDFHSGIGANLIFLQALRPGLELILSHIGNLPVDILQAMFASLSPTLTSRKFQSFAALQPQSKSAGNFVTLEDWLNDGVPLVSNVARECLFDWYLENSPLAENWKIAGTPIRPQSINCPSLTIIPTHDHIVPPGSALALADRLPQNEQRTIKTGHIGMVTGSQAKSALYEPLTQWIKSHP